jgi:tRNA(His) guanylyltransferase
MAKSKYEYVKEFEVPPVALPNTWMVVRVDGKVHLQSP